MRSMEPEWCGLLTEVEDLSGRYRLKTHLPGWNQDITEDINAWENASGALPLKIGAGATNGGTDSSTTCRLKNASAVESSKKIFWAQSENDLQVYQSRRQKRAEGKHLRTGTGCRTLSRRCGRSVAERILGGVWASGFESAGAMG
jgi:hypothetical protein